VNKGYNAYCDILFAADAQVCTGDQFTRETHSREVGPSGPFICVNSLAANTARSDSNVACFRNFLIEIDKIPLVDQATYIEEIKMPWSAAIYSGGKSIHYIISLDEPCKTEKEYRELASFLIDDVVTLADKSNKNPSRFTRTPDFIRPDTGRKQEIMELRKRVTNEELKAFLEPYAKIRHIKQKAARKAARIKRVKLENARQEGTVLSVMDLVNARTRRFLAEGATEGDRHNELKTAMLDLWHNGAELEQIEVLVTPAADLSGIGARGDVEGLVEWFRRNKL
jgi:hypothetical protein